MSSQFKPRHVPGRHSASPPDMHDDGSSTDASSSDDEPWAHARPGAVHGMPRRVAATASAATSAFVPMSARAHVPCPGTEEALRARVQAFLRHCVSRSEDMTFAHFVDIHRTNPMVAHLVACLAAIPSRVQRLLPAVVVGEVRPLYILAGLYSRYLDATARRCRDEHPAPAVPGVFWSPADLLAPGACRVKAVGDTGADVHSFSGFYTPFTSLDLRPVGPPPAKRTPSFGGAAAAARYLRGAQAALLPRYYRTERINGEDRIIDMTPGAPKRARASAKKAAASRTRSTQ